MEHFMYLVKELEHFVKSKAIMFVTSLLEPIKDIGFMLYWFVHGISANIIAIIFNVGASLCGSMLTLLLMF